MTHSWWWLAVNALATFRLAVLVSKDKITDRPRRALGRLAYPELAGVAGGGPKWAIWLYELVVCPWCIGIWIAAGVTALTVVVPAVWQYPAYALALAGVAGFIGERSQ